jgi:integrase
VRLTTRNSRAALPVGIYWRIIDPGIQLGYRKRELGGRWLVRWYVGSKKYRQRTLGAADDARLTHKIEFEAASKLARATALLNLNAIQTTEYSTPLTVRSVVEDYIELRNARHSERVGRSVRSDAASRLGLHVLSAPIANIKLSSLTENDLHLWKSGLDSRLMASSRWRTLSDLKSALNIAHLRYRNHLTDRFGDIIKFGLRRDDYFVLKISRSRDRRVLDDEVIRQIVKVAEAHDVDGDVWRMILVLASTGARFSQVQRLQVRDLQCDRQRLMMPASRKGRDRGDDYYPVRIGADVVEALRPLTVNRPHDAPLLCRWKTVRLRGKPRHRARANWTSASELTRHWKGICASAGITSVVPYALRHSSIVRCIRAGLPIRLVASIHDTSVMMIERHYSRYIADSMEEIAAKAIVPLLDAPPPE